MPNFTFDVKLFATVHVEAPDEKAARAALDEGVGDTLEGTSWLHKDGRTMFVNSASQDGEADLVEDDEDSGEMCDECGAHLDGPHEFGCPKWDTF